MLKAYVFIKSYLWKDKKVCITTDHFEKDKIHLLENERVLRIEFCWKDEYLHLVNPSIFIDS